MDSWISEASFNARRIISRGEPTEQLRNMTILLETDFSRRRAKYRSKTWSAAVAKYFGNFKVRNGRESLQATITRVTDVGLEIRHEGGIARIQAPDLDFKLQNRFQRIDAEMREVLEVERENREGNGHKRVMDDFEHGVNPKSSAR